jgi:hypothetical protein
MSDHLYDAFDVCLAALSTGVDLESCLSLYPDLKDELRPALLAAQQARLLERRDVPKAALVRSRAKMLSHMAELRKAHRPFFLPISIPRPALATLALILVLFLSLNGLVVASAQSLPGDALYPVKRAAEDVSLKLAPSAEVRRKMSEDYQQRRTDEIGSLMALNLVRNIALEGVVDETGDGRIVLDGIPVIISADTKLSGELKPGRLVKLEGVTRPGGWIEADNIQLRFYEYGGRLNATQRGTWTIDDKNFKILTSTHIDPALKVGDQVLVLVYSSDDGTQYAQAVLRIPESLSSQTAGFEPFEVEISGTVEGVSGDKLLVNGKNIKITDQTEIKGDVAIGSVIKVHALVAADGSLTASKIEPATQELIGSEEQKSDDDSSGDAEDSSSVSDDHSGDDASSSESDSDEDNSSISNDDGSEDDKSGSETSDDSEDKNDSDSDDDHKGSDDDHEDSEDKGKEEDGKPDD